MTATTTSPVAELLARESWSREQLEAHQRRRLEALYAHAAAHSPYYREVLATSDPPVLTKQTLMEQWDRIVCDPRLDRAGVEAHAAGPHAAEPYLGEFQVFSTSGSSGLRGLFVYSARDWEAAVVHTMRAVARIGARPGERTIGIGAPPGVHMSQRIFGRLQSAGEVPRLSALTPLPEMVAALNGFQPEILFGYPTIAALLAAEQLAGRLRIAPRLIALGSEPLTAEMRETMHRAWGFDPGEYYSTTEAATVAASTPDHPRALELFEDQFVIEIVDEHDRPVPPGTAGAKVLITNLENSTLPLIRYALEDRVVESPDANPAGRPFRHLQSIDGRTADTLTFPGRDGGTVSMLPLRMGAPFARLPDVRQFQIVHDAAGLEIRLVLDDAAAPDIPERVRAAVTAAIEEAGAVPPAIAVRAVDGLEREPGAAAKLKLIVSRAG
jgi:phenylacetate-coenzyme A ligase PaaK-like adenylate-forming protein